MTKKWFFSLLVVLLLALPLLVSCNGDDTDTTTPTTTTETTNTPSVTSSTGNWWDEFGEPQYGGTITRRTSSSALSAMLLDPWTYYMGADLRLVWYEKLAVPDWTVDRDEFPFTTGWIPLEYLAGQLAESWEQTDPQTAVITIRQGVYWRDIPPVNGREFTAEDVQYNYERMLGIGSFTEPNPIYAGNLSFLEKVTATGQYTVEFKFKEPSAMALDLLFTNSTFGLAAPEWIEQGDTEDWQNVAGTGPWILTDWEPSVSVTFSRNPDYWGYDERYPENQLPYADTFRSVAIEDMTTSLAALRTGQIDMLMEIQGPTLEQAQSLAESNPEIQQAFWPASGLALATRVDAEPFTDIRVRKALQMAINLEEIAQSYYGGTAVATASGIMHPTFQDWTTPYEEWPAELQAEYSYNPELARELLAEAGYPDGFETNCITANVFDMQIHEIVSAYLMGIGVDMEINTYDMSAFNPMARAGEFDQIAVCGNTGMTGGPTDLAVATPGDVRNYMQVDDPTYNALYNEMKATTSLDEAKAISKEMNMYALEQHWFIATNAKSNPIMWQPWIKGFSGEITQSGRQDIGMYYTRFWVDQEMKTSMGY